MKELIVVRKQIIGDEEVNTVDARELHAFLESRQDFSDWIKGRVDKYDFVEGIDFIKFHNFMESDSKARTDYVLTLDMAKQITMIERNKKGKQARRYFIDCEKKLLKIKEAVMERPRWFIEGYAVRDIMVDLFKAPEHIAMSEVAKHIKKFEGPDATGIVGILPCSQNLLIEEEMLEPTELGKRCGVSGTQMNRYLAELGLQYREGGQWVLTEKGKSISSRHAWQKGNKSGYNLKWNVSAVKDLFEKAL